MPAPLDLPAAFAPLPVSRRTLAVASLFAGVAAAFVGTFLSVVFAALWDASHRSDGLVGAAMMIPVGAAFLTLFGSGSRFRSLCPPR